MEEISGSISSSSAAAASGEADRPRTTPPLSSSTDSALTRGPYGAPANSERGPLSSLRAQFGMCNNPVQEGSGEFEFDPVAAVVAQEFEVLAPRGIFLRVDEPMGPPAHADRAAVALVALEPHDEFAGLEMPG